MPGHKMWPTSTLAKPLPTPFRKLPGGPNKRKRKLEADEGRGGKKQDFVVREFKQRRCGNCGTLGHNRKKCTNSPKPLVTMEKSKGERPRKGFVSSSSKPIAATSQPQQSIPIVPTATITTPAAPSATTTSTAPTTMPTSVNMQPCPLMTSPSNGGRKKSCVVESKKTGARKYGAPRVISTQTSSRSHHQSTTSHNVVIKVVKFRTFVVKLVDQTLSFNEL